MFLLNVYYVYVDINCAKIELINYKTIPKWIKKQGKLKLIKNLN
jgi:hypothetical protein